jgi:polysaccharide chain length determinant protein (PEP-CTERM system associated)
MNSILPTPRTEQSAMAIVHEYLGIAQRSKWLILGCVAISVALAWSYCLIATKYYRSETLLVVEEPKLLESVVQKSVDDKFEQRLFLVQRQIMSLNFLSSIAKEFELYPEARETGDEDAAVVTMAGATLVERVKMDPSIGSGLNGVEAFTVSFMHPDPRTAMQVTARIAEKFIDENNREREKDAEGTAVFLDDELRRLKIELEKKEEQISQFKTAHIGELPQQTDANLRALDRLEIELNTVNEGIQRQSDKLAMLDSAMHDYRVYGRQIPAFKSAASLEADPLYRRHKELREKLIQLKAEFYDEYPEVLVTKEELRQIEAELIELSGPDAVRPDKSVSDPYVQDLVKLQTEAKSELNLLRHRQQMLYAAKKDHERRVERFPGVEQELLTLERDYTNMKGNYAMLLDKRLHARVTENLEKQQKSGKYRILDSASLPRTPVKPNRPRVLVLGLLFGCVLGVGLSVLRERLTPQFRRAEDVEVVIGPQLLAAIPDFSFLWNPTKARRNFTSSYLPRRLSTLEESIERMDSPRHDGTMLQNYSSNTYATDRRFVAKLFPRSMAAEQYRVAAARLQLSSGGAATAVVTSAIKGEGKTTTVINLGYTLARDFGKRVLLVDCDFVYPELKCFIEKPTQYGLIDYLRGDCKLEDAITSFAEIPCWIMPAGVSETDPTELSKTDRLEWVFSQMRGKFDYVLLNAPPILPVATMNVLERHVDLLLLVVRASQTSQQVVRRALGSLRGSKPIQVVLNGVATQSLPYYMTDYNLLESRQRV